MDYILQTLNKYNAHSIFITMKFLHFLLLMLLAGSIQAQSSKTNKLLEKGILLTQKNKWDKAEKLFDKLLASDEATAEIYVWKAKCLLQFGEYANAYQHITMAIQIEPTNADFHIAQGDLKLFVGQSRIQKTQQCNECGKTILPSHSNYNQIKAEDYYEAAILNYKKAQQLNPQSTTAAYQLALAHSYLNQKQKACTYYQQALELGYNSSDSSNSTFCE